MCIDSVSYASDIFQLGLYAQLNLSFNNIMSIISSSVTIIIIIHLFAINKQSLTQSKEWHVTRET